MKFIQRSNPNQAELFCLEQAVDPDNLVRLIHLFVLSLNLSDFGFKTDFVENGRPAYHPSDLLRLYIYGYLNKIRSSRDLEKECKRNIEVMWLLGSLRPDHNTISNFRRDNPQAIKKVFRSTVKLAKHFELIGGELLAGDSTKLRAQNSKKRNFNAKKIERNLSYIESRLEEYNAILASEDGDENQKKEARQKIAQHLGNKENYLQMQKQLEQSGDTQISLTDTESRQLITRNNITEVAFNIQSTTDDKHFIPVDYLVTNENDSKAMGPMARRAKTIIGHTNFILLYDKGFHTGSEFEYADRHDIEVMVAVPELASHAPDTAFDIKHFRYDKISDTYTCPANQQLTTNGSWYNKNRGKSINKVKHYKTKACLSYPMFEGCTKNKEGRLIERSEYADLIDANLERNQKNKNLYKKRQAIIEHNYGIIKRQWGFYYIMTKQGMKRATADVGLIFTAYNLRRIFNIIGTERLKKHFGSLIIKICLLQTYFKQVWAIFKFEKPNFEFSLT